MDEKIRVYLIDDERPVLDGVSKMISENFSSFEVVGTSLTGAKALEEIPSSRVDLVLADINLPGMKGTEVIQRLKGIRNDLCFAMLTAYERFDIAKDAVDLGVSAYILKPVTPRKLQEILPKLELEIKQKRNRLERLVQGQGDDEKDQILSRLWFFRSVHQRGETPEENLIKRSLGFLDHGCLLVAVVGKEEDALTLEKFLGYRMELYPGGRYRHRSFFIIRERNLPDLESLIKHHPELELSFHNQKLDPDSSLYSQISQMVEEDEGEEYQDTTLNWYQHDSFLAGAITPLIHQLEDSLDGKGFEELLAHISWELGAVKERLEGLLPEGKRLPHLDLSRLSEAKKIPRLFQVAQDFLETYHRIFSQLSRFSPLIQKVLAEVEKDLSMGLEELADLYGVSGAHLSRQFSKEMGVGLSGYLTHRRIEKAKFLLREYDLPISEIASTCGFQDSNYFSKVFKKHTGINPSHYGEKDEA